MTTMDYSTFLSSKRIEIAPSGFDVDASDLHSGLFNWQADCVSWALRRGKASLFHGCGLGKTIQQLAWADKVVERFNGPVLIVAPLAVSHQTVREGEKFGIKASIANSGDDIRGGGIYVTNYEKLPRFNLKQLRLPGVVADESSRIKDHTSATRNIVIEQFSHVPMRLACTATPAPNDLMEMAQHSEYVGALTRSEMLSTFFVHDGGDTSKWRLKGHAQDEYWKWVCQWAVMMTMPSDLGYDDNGFILPPLTLNQHTVQSNKPLDGQLFLQEAATLNERRQARRDSLSERVKLCVDIVKAKPDVQWLIWTDLNDEADMAEKLLDGAVQIAGRHSDEEKESRMLGFIDGSIQTLVSKPSICAHGLNLQFCADVVFLGLSDSWERFYQAVRRCWRFGQRNPVNVHVITSEAEGAVVRNIERKEREAMVMGREMVKHMSVYNKAALRHVRIVDEYNPAIEMSIPNWLRTEAAQ